ncbi:Appr-1-p processing protein [bacterium]|nr:MAG: Appr-1-p processing protein [bacterium]
MNVRVVEGDLLDQKADAIVNAWNRNTIPWWLLLPQGVSGAIKRRGGTEPLKELRKHGRMALGEAVTTRAGRLPFKGIIHVAGIDDLWRGSEEAARLSARNAVREAEKQGFDSLAIPLIGSGSWGLSSAQSEAAILDELSRIESEVEVVVVRFRASPLSSSA